jgi:hypothetical protein
MLKKGHFGKMFFGEGAERYTMVWLASLYCEGVW